MTQSPKDILRRKFKSAISEDDMNSFDQYDLHSHNPKYPTSRQNKKLEETSQIHDNICQKIDNYFSLEEIYQSPTTGYKFQTYYEPPVVKSNNTSVIFVMHHGAGSSAATFAKLAYSLKIQCELRSHEDKPGVFTFDMRGHGRTGLLNLQDQGANGDLSIDTLCEDFRQIMVFLDEKFKGQNTSTQYFLIGHSLGGSVLTKFTTECCLNNDPTDLNGNLCGLVMIDIVGGTAIRALSTMDQYLSSVPKHFASVKQAIDWHLASNLLHNHQSAIVSVPALLKKSQYSASLEWIVNLRDSSIHWQRWFKNLSQEFVALPSRISRLLILANNDSLDKDLMIGQMQGKYQLIVFHNSQLGAADPFSASTKMMNSLDSAILGHFVHEDIPFRVASSLMDFVERNSSDFAASGPSSSALKSQKEYLNAMNEKWGVASK
ncbi:hypothetical protein OGAPHI_003580 [Ogataea philodendri]|uniref:Protein phosphatase methylesterase 1 n=1 Tax=Ogataea philodendri TaxID=1378263 RepID=A0A9P8P5H5_9ASCO|nr:uncharacterized protein OGAPHI_003580 [Ogataea philodendri]KAH3665396.1 hypothetical protein OGAPHI_003580 [Ogataea philodendri]